MSEHPAIQRLQDQLRFYDRSSVRKRKGYRLIRGLDLIVAASVAPAAALGGSSGLLAVLGACVVVLHGLQEVFQSRSRYLAHRHTYELLKCEETLFLSHAGPYRGVDDVEALLAERVEEIRGRETAEWVEEERQRLASTGQQQLPSAPQSGGAPGQ